MFNLPIKNNLVCSNGCTYPMYNHKYCRFCGSKMIPKENIICECKKKLPSRGSGGFCTNCGKDIRKRWNELQKKYN